MQQPVRIRGTGIGVKRDVVNDVATETRQRGAISSLCTGRPWLSKLACYATYLYDRKAR